MENLTWLEISKKALKNNVCELKRLIGDNSKLGVIVKANAYGHGLQETSKIFADAGADWFCVNSFEELEVIRNSGILLPVLIIGFVPQWLIKKALELKAIFFASDLDFCRQISKEITGNGSAKIFIKIDTGMSRQGIHPDELDYFLKEMPANIEIVGMATHFASADGEIQNGHFRKQFESFKKISDKAETILEKKLILTCANSAATMIYPQTRMNLIRSGLASYGYYPNEEYKKLLAEKIKLIPALSFKTIIMAVKKIPKDSYVGYGCTYKTARDTKIAILPVGYYDGLDRKLSNCGEILVNGKRAKIIGRICMNQTIVDITDNYNAKIGDEAVILGKQGDEELSPWQTAQIVGTNCYEIISRIRENIPKIYIE